MSRQVVYGLVTAALVAGLFANVTAEENDSGPEGSREQFNEVMSRLDKGGDLLVVANVEGWLESALASLSQLAQLDNATDPATRQVAAAMTKLPVFLQENGFYAVRGLGMSIVPREDGFNDVRIFIHRDGDAALLPLWRACFGIRPQRMAGLDFLPADTVLARTCAGEPAQAWKLICAAVTELGGPMAEAAFQGGLDQAAAQLGTGVDALIAGLGKESFVSIQFARDRTIELPTMAPGQQAVTIPAPSLLIGLAVTDDSLTRVIEQQIAKQGLPVQKKTFDEIIIQTMSLPVPSPIPIQMSFATCNDMLLIGSGPDIIQSALTANRQKNGLLVTDEFKAAFDDLPLENSGLVYIDKRFAETLLAVQSSMMQNMPQVEGMEGMMLMQKLAGQEGPQFTAMVTENFRSGVLTRGVSSSSGRDVAAGMLVAPVGMMAAIAIPSFVKARATSQQNACINNLRRIDAAKEQWALATKAVDGNPVDQAAMVQYIRGSHLPECPGGGTYSVNVVGTNPTCSKPGHHLR